jgi:hypothetical protein
MSSDFQNEYASLSDEEILQLASDRLSLVKEASAALDNQMRSRHLTHADLVQYQLRMKHYERQQSRKRARKLFGGRRDKDSWVETAGMLFWSALAIALISIAYLALPARFQFSPPWQESAEYVMFGSVLVAAPSFGPLWRNLRFWICLLISSVVHASILHSWIIRRGSIDSSGHRGAEKMAVVLGPVLFLLVYGCQFLIGRKFLQKSTEYR